MDFEPQSIAPVHFPETLREQMRQHALAAYPEECCGILLGRDNSVRQVVPAQNAADPPARRRTYALNPREILRLDREARAKNLEIIGYYHSHPDHPAVPSETDRALAWEGLLYVIVPTTAAGSGEPRVWRFGSTEDFSEVPFAP